MFQFQKDVRNTTKNVLTVSETLDPWLAAAGRSPSNYDIYIDCYPLCTYAIDAWGDYKNDFYPAVAKEVTGAWVNIKG